MHEWHWHGLEPTHGMAVFHMVFQQLNLMFQPYLSPLDSRSRLRAPATVFLLLLHSYLGLPADQYYTIAYSSIGHRDLHEWEGFTLH